MKYFLAGLLAAISISAHSEPWLDVFTYKGPPFAKMQVNVGSYDLKRTDKGEIIVLMQFRQVSSVPADDGSWIALIDARACVDGFGTLQIVVPDKVQQEYWWIKRGQTDQIRGYDVVGQTLCTSLEVHLDRIREKSKSRKQI